MNDKVETTQIQRFRKAAKERSADESEAAFTAKLRKIAQAKVTSDPPPETRHPVVEESADDERPA